MVNSLKLVGVLMMVGFLGLGVAIVVAGKYWIACPGIFHVIVLRIAAVVTGSSVARWLLRLCELSDKLDAVRSHFVSQLTIQCLMLEL